MWHPGACRGGWLCSRSQFGLGGWNKLAKWNYVGITLCDYRQGCRSGRATEPGQSGIAGTHTRTHGHATIQSVLSGRMGFLRMVFDEVSYWDGLWD